MNNNMEKMIEMASRKLGVSPEKLKNSLSGGNMEDMISNMRTEDREKLKSILQNKELREKLMKSPEAAELLKKMKKE